MNHWRDVRSQNGNKLLFRFCVETDQIEIKTSTGKVEVVALDELRPVHQRRFGQVVDETKHLCYDQLVGSR